MEKLNFKNNQDIDYETMRNDKINLLIKETIIKDLLEEYNININDINNLSLLEEYLINKKICDKCRGLKECPFTIKGQRLILEYNHLFYPVKEYCKYYKNDKEKHEFINNIIYNDIPYELSFITLENISFDKNNNDIIKLYVLFNKILDNSDNKGLYIYGSFGTGKTYMSIAFINSLAIKNKKCAFVKVNDFINKMRKMIINEPIEYEYTIDDIKKVPYLVLDDIGAESNTAYARDDLLFNILDYRMEHKLVTVFTSNHSLSTLKEAFVYDNKLNKETLKAERLMERIRVLGREFHLSGNNLRK